MKLSIKHINRASLHTKAGRHLREIPLFAVIAIALIFTSSSAWAAHAIATHNDVAATQKTMSLAKSNQSGQSAAQTASTITTGKTTADSTGKQLPQSSASAQSSSQPTIKYSISPDPRSTAYSLTPPKPNPASFDTTITHNGQVARGTLISYNATKGDKTYYAGDYVFSSPTLVVHKSKTLLSPLFTISTPDGDTANEPALPWNASSDYYWPYTSTPDGPGKSWNMTLQVASSTPVGSYQVHLTSFRTGDGVDAWEYDGFVTLDVDN